MPLTPYCIVIIIIIIIIIIAASKQIGGVSLSCLFFPCFSN